MKKRPTYREWLLRLCALTERAEAQGSGLAKRLRGECKHQADSWYKSSRYSGSNYAPEDEPELADRLRWRRGVKP